MVPNYSPVNDNTHLSLLWVERDLRRKEFRKLKSDPNMPWPLNDAEPSQLIFGRHGSKPSTIPSASYSEILLISNLVENPLEGHKCACLRELYSLRSCAALYQGRISLEIPAEFARAKFEFYC